MKKTTLDSFSPETYPNIRDIYSNPSVFERFLPFLAVYIVFLRR
jgi:hypothetical protein